MHSIIKAVAGIIYDKDNHLILIAKKKKGESKGLWEFAGGKVKKNESLEDALHRELKEELNITIYDVKYYDSIELRDEDKLIQLYFFTCVFKDGEIILEDHDEAKWVSKKDLALYSFMDSDKIIVSKLSANSNNIEK